MNKNNDQWFEPGDKVCRVAYADGIGRLSNGIFIPESDFGRVLCVESCFEFGSVNAVTFVGLEAKGAWHAACFRKVEEIRLCVQAVKKITEPQKELQP